MSSLIAELPYHEDGAALFERIAHRPWAVYLDSGHPGSSYGRYDILAADPFITLTTCGGSTEIQERNGVHASQEDPFALLKGVLLRFPDTNSKAMDFLPFSGGAIGYFGYDLARRLEQLPAVAVDAELTPEMAVGIYDWAVVIDHQVRKAWLVGLGNDVRTQQNWQQFLTLFSERGVALTASFSISSPVTSNMDEMRYGYAFHRVQDYVYAGDCYQVNLAQRFAAHAEGEPWIAYQQLRRISPAPYSAYFNTPSAQILSASPERFLSVRNGHVETRPIKGTRPRSPDSAKDEANAEELRSSLKDRAENLMIVDLLRNDIGKNCAIGSVKADRLFELESFSNVHHLVSTVTGNLTPGRHVIDLLRGCFPGGSITGAPKLRAMEIIEELEPHRRGVYCGAIGYVGFNGNMDTNIAIRTAVFSGNTIRFWAGGGIVADSELEKEYRETLDKASCMLQLMTYFGADNVGG
jgi:para-aminobenzoate synthetase component 1